MLHGTPTVLVVDDEPAVRGFMADVLRMNGYQTRSASHGLEALEMCIDGAGPPDLLVTDVMMPPHLNGVELAWRLLARKADMQVLFVSAFAADPLVSQAILGEKANFLPKPLSPIALAQKVNSFFASGREVGGKAADPQKATVLMAVADGMKRQWIRECLRGSGIWVLEALHQAEARFMAEWHEGPIHLLLTDLPKPIWKRGDELKRMQILHPTMEVLFVENEETLVQPPPPENREFSELWRAVRGMLSAHAELRGSSLRNEIH